MPQSTRNLYDRPGGRVIGFVEHTLGGFWRSYSYSTSMGTGPYATEAEAEASVRRDWEQDKAAAAAQRTGRRRRNESGYNRVVGGRFPVAGQDRSTWPEIVSIHRDGSMDLRTMTHGHWTVWTVDADDMIIPGSERRVEPQFRPPPGVCDECRSYGPQARCGHAKRRRGRNPEAEAEEEPEVGDWLTQDHVHFYEAEESANGTIVGRTLVCTLTIPERSFSSRRVEADEGELSTAAMWTQLEACMKSQNYYPTVWWVSDHGNPHLLERPGLRRR